MAVILQPYGNLDLKGSAKFQQKLRQLLDSTPKSHSLWIVDLSKVRDIDHFGLTALALVRNLAKKEGSRLILRGVPASIRNVLKIAYLESEFEFWPDSEERDDEEETSGFKESRKPANRPRQTPRDRRVRDALQVA